MQIKSTIQKTAPKQTPWFYNRERTPGVISESPADQLRDTVSIAATTAGVSVLAAGVVNGLGYGALGATALAVPLALGGALAGGLASGITQEAVGYLIGARPDNDAGMGAIAGGAVVSAIAAGAGAIAAGFGADPSTIAATAAAASGGFLILAGTMAG